MVINSMHWIESVQNKGAYFKNDLLCKEIKKHFCIFDEINQVYYQYPFLVVNDKYKYLLHLDILEYVRLKEI